MNEETRLMYLTLVGEFYINLLVAGAITTDNKWLTAIQSPTAGQGATSILRLAERMVGYMFANLSDELNAGGD
jgi:hypothetical protein